MGKKIQIERESGGFLADSDMQEIPQTGQVPVPPRRDEPDDKDVAIREALDALAEPTPNYKKAERALRAVVGE